MLLNMMSSFVARVSVCLRMFVCVCICVCVRERESERGREREVKRVYVEQLGLHGFASIVCRWLILLLDVDKILQRVFQDEVFRS